MESTTEQSWCVLYHPGKEIPPKMNRINFLGTKEQLKKKIKELQWSKVQMSTRMKCCGWPFRELRINKSKPQRTKLHTVLWKLHTTLFGFSTADGWHIKEKPNISFFPLPLKKVKDHWKCHIIFSGFDTDPQPFHFYRGAFGDPSHISKCFKTELCLA